MKVIDRLDLMQSNEMKMREDTAKGEAATKKEKDF
jgi:hypothetical protein